MNEELFLIDTNSLITPHLEYYPFDFAPGFWKQMEQQIKTGRIIIMDMIKNEILQGNNNDELTEWMKDIEIGMYLDHREAGIVTEYGKILQYIQGEPCYKTSALTEWAKRTVADAWLIAAAKEYGYTLITLEVRNYGLSSKNPSKFAKIPDVAMKFGVKTANLFYMMRELGFSL